VEAPIASESSTTVGYEWFYFNVTDADVENGMDFSMYARGHVDINPDQYQIGIPGKKVTKMFPVEPVLASGKAVIAQDVGLFIRPASEDKFRPFNDTDFDPVVGLSAASESDGTGDAGTGNASTDDTETDTGSFDLN